MLGMVPQSTTPPAQRALFVLLVLSLVGVVLVFRSLAVSLFLAGALGATFWPLHQRLTRWMRGRKSLAATVLVILVVTLVLTPLVALTIFVVKEAIEAFKFVAATLRSSGVEGLLTSLPDVLENAVRGLLKRIPEGAEDDLSKGVQTQLGSTGGAAAAAFGSVVAATGSMLFQATMMLIALYFFLTEKEQILQWLDDASPLRRGQTRELLQEFKLVTVAVLRSTVLTALVQALAALVGYYLADVPYPVFFGAVTFGFAMIPAIGAASVCLVAAALMYLGGHPFAAIFLVAWGLLVVGLADNVVKPLLIKGQVAMHGGVVFFALLGGLAAFGAIGLILGPLAVALFVSVLRIYRRDYGKPDDPVSVPPSREPAAGSAK